MAKFIPTLGEVRGSIGGLTFGKNPVSSTVYLKPSRIVSQDYFQLTFEQVSKAAAAMWSLMSPEQKNNAKEACLAQGKKSVFPWFQKGYRYISYINLFKPSTQLGFSASGFESRSLQPSIFDSSLPTPDLSPRDVRNETFQPYIDAIVFNSLNFQLSFDIIPTPPDSIFNQFKSLQSDLGLLIFACPKLFGRRQKFLHSSVPFVHFDSQAERQTISFIRASFNVRNARKDLRACTDWKFQFYLVDYSSFGAVQRIDVL